MSWDSRGVLDKGQEPQMGYISMNFISSAKTGTVCGGRDGERWGSDPFYFSSIVSPWWNDYYSYAKVSVFQVVFKLV